MPLLRPKIRDNQTLPAMGRKQTHFCFTVAYSDELYNTFIDVHDALSSLNPSLAYV